jgi:hypothetical protein
MKRRGPCPLLSRRDSGTAGLTEVATLDRRHFTAVRPKHADALTLLP